MQGCHKLWSVGIRLAKARLNFDTHQDIDAAWLAGQIDFDKPYVVNSRSLIKDMETAKFSVLKTTMDSWALQFRGAAQCKGTNKRTQALLTPVTNNKKREQTDGARLVHAAMPAHAALATPLGWLVCARPLSALPKSSRPWQRPTTTNTPRTTAID